MTVGEELGAGSPAPGPRFSLADAMVMIAATAVGLGLIRVTHLSDLFTSIADGSAEVSGGGGRRIAWRTSSILHVYTN
jgi:hypothetical protein